MMGTSDIHRKSVSADESVEFDDAIVLTGYGRFHFESLAACALGIVIVGFQNGVGSYIFPAAQCELDSASSQLGYLNVAFSVGGMGSCFLWGSLADSLGRKSVLIMSLLLDCVVMVVLSVSNHVSCSTICRFLNGFFAGAPGSVLLSYLGEFQPPKSRSGIICGAGLFFTSSWLLLPILAWLILPLNIHVTIGSWFILTPWRLYSIFVAIPEGVLGSWFSRLPESPKYLSAIGKKNEALAISKKMFASNKRRSPDEYPVKSLYCPIVENGFMEKVGCMGKGSRMSRDMRVQMKSLFKTPLLFITILSCTIMFTNMFGAFGLGLWLPESFVRFKQYAVLHPNETVTLEKLSLLTVDTNKTCDSTFDLSVIQNTVIMGVTSSVTSVFCGYISTKVSIKTVPSVCMFLGGLASASIYWLRSATQNSIVASVFQATMIVANMSLSGVVVESFPTSVGATAICLAMFMGRMGAMTSNMVFGLSMDEHCEIPIFAVAANVLLGALLCWIIPVSQVEEKTEKNSYVAGKTVEISLVTLPKDEYQPRV